MIWFNAAAVLIFWLIFWNRWYNQCAVKIPVVSKETLGLRDNFPLVSIILPVRNEAHQIENYLPSLLNQDYPNLEIIVVDDCSEDGTGDILKIYAADHSRLKLVDGQPQAEEWMGKAHAMYQGYRVARGEWLLFTDAHTWHAPYLLSQVMARILLSKASVAIVLASQRQPSFGVYLVNLAVFGCLFMVTNLRKFLDPRSRQSLINDQYLLITREAYKTIGTHEAVKKYSSNDASFGYLAKLKGFVPVILYGGKTLVSTMYTTPVRAFRGWSRSLVNGAWTSLGPVKGSAALVMVTFGLLFFWVVPWLTWLDGLGKHHTAQSLTGFLQLLAVLAVLLLTSRNPWKAFGDLMVMPASYLIFAAMVGTGLIGAALRGGTIQKGRVVPTKKCLPPWKPAPERLRNDIPEIKESPDGREREQR